MNWQNWTEYANQVLYWILALIPQVLGVMMDNPIIGVPVILLIIGLVLNLVIKFIGSLGSNKSES